jgi:hypothetical protein
MIQPLPPVEKPIHEQGPRPCSSCRWSYLNENHLRCSKMKYRGQLCTFSRHETGECGPDGLYWSEWE